MSEASKAARAAMKSKIKRITSADPKAKVDASSWTPPEPLNADIKTGARPISPRAFKRGGKVSGEAAEMNAGRKPRTGNKPVSADSLINRNVKEANEEREGIKHVGAFKKGGRTGKATGGANEDVYPPRQRWDEEKEKWIPLPPKAPFPGSDKEIGPMGPSSFDNPDKFRPGKMNKGGRTAKKDGGETDERSKIVSPDRFDFGRGTRASPYKKGGMAKWEGSAKDEAQDKKLAKKHGMTMKAWESSKMDEKHDKQHSMEGLKKGGRAGKLGGGVMSDPAFMGGASAMYNRAGKKEGGGESLDGEIQGTRPKGGRTARKSGGRTGKTHININIGGAGAGQPPMGMKPPMGSPPGAGAPPPMAQPPAGPPPAQPPGGMPAGLPPGLANLLQGRKSGGRTYPKMRYGAGSGLGRLEKIEEYGKKN